MCSCEELEAGISALEDVGEVHVQKGLSQMRLWLWLSGVESVDWGCCHHAAQWQDDRQKNDGKGLEHDGQIANVVGV